MHMWIFLVYYLAHGKVSRVTTEGAFYTKTECVEREQYVIANLLASQDPMNAIVYGTCQDALEGADRSGQFQGRLY